MTLQTPKGTWLRHEVVDTDPIWPGAGEVTSSVLAIPAPGYAICWYDSGNRLGFLEIEFTAEEPTLEGGGGTAEITDLLFTEAVDTGDDSYLVTPENFAADSTIVVCGVEQFFPDFDYGKIIHFAATYGTTFGSLSVGSIGYGSIVHPDHTNEGDANVIAANAETVVFAWATLANAGEGGEPSTKYIAHFGSTPVGTTDTGLWDHDHDDVYHVDSSSIDAQADTTSEGVGEWFLAHNGTKIMAYGFMALTTVADYWVSTEINIDGSPTGVYSGHGATIDFDFGETTRLDATRPTSRFRGTPSSVLSLKADGNWWTTTPEMEANNADVMVGVTQAIESGVWEGNDSSSVRRTWDPDTGENLDAWYLSGFEKARVQVDPPAWIGRSFFGGHDHLHLYTEAPPEPPPFEPDPEVPHGYCITPVEDPDFYVYPDNDGLFALGRNDRLSIVTDDWLLDDPEDPDYFRTSYIVTGWPSVMTRYASENVYGAGDDKYPRAMAAAGDTIYWIDWETHDLHEGGSGDAPVVMPAWISTDSVPSMVWNEADQALYVMSVDVDGFVAEGWSLHRVDPDTWTSAVVASSDVPPDDSPLRPVVTPDGAVWCANILIDADGDRAWLRYVPGVGATVTPWQYWLYWGYTDWPIPAFTSWPFVPRPDNSVWFQDTWNYPSVWYRLDASGSISRVPLMDIFEYGPSEGLAASPDVTEVAIDAYVPTMSGYHLFRLARCGGPRWTVGKSARWGERRAWS